MKIRLVITMIALAAACTLASAGRAEAKSCTFGSGTMAFGNYDVFGAALAVTGTITLSCTNAGNPTPTITLSAGSSGTTANRSMPCTSGQCLTSFPSDLLHYNLYTTIAHTTVWAATGQPTTPANCKNTTCTASVFGLIPAAVSGGTNDIAAGGYADSVTVTVTY